MFSLGYLARLKWLARVSISIRRFFQHLGDVCAILIPIVIAAKTWESFPCCFAVANKLEPKCF